MASEWQTVSNNNKKGNKTLNQSSTPAPFTLGRKSDNNNNIFNKTTSLIVNKSIVKYTKEHIYLYKQINKDQQVSYELSATFDKINEMFKTSTQYIESKKKINYNQSNHNRWELKKEEDNNIINIICSGLNKITESNMNDILKEIEVQEIVIYDDLEKLTEKIIHKCISEDQFLHLYTLVIKHIITKCKWIVDDNNMVPITFRRILLNQLEMRFSNLINDVKNMKYDESESELIVIHNKLKKGLINLITKLYNHKIIGNQLVRYIFRNLENAYDENKNDQYLEYWLILFKSVMENWIISEKIYLNEQIQYIISKLDKSKSVGLYSSTNHISNKIKFMIQDQLDILKSKNYDYNIKLSEKEDKDKDEREDKEDKKEEEEEEDEYEKEDEYEREDKEDKDEESYDLIILSSLEYNTLDKWFETLDNSILPEKLLLDLLQITLSEKKYFDTVKNLLEYLLNKKYVSREQVKEKIKYIKNENDLSEYKYYEKHLDELEII
jgi:hypothetical protein